MPQLALSLMAIVFGRPRKRGINDLSRWEQFGGTIERPAAIRPASPTDSTTLGNGNYKMEAIYLGGGFGLKLD